MIKERSIFDDIVSVFATKILVLAISLATMVIIAKALGAEGRGYLAILLVIPQLMIAIFEGGMRQASIYYIGKSKFSREKVLGAILLYVLASSLIGYLFAVGLMILNYDHFGLLLIFIAASMLPFTLYVNTIQGFLLGDERIAEFNKVLWHSKILYFFLLLSLYALDNLTILSTTICNVIAAGYNSVQGYRYLFRSHISPSYNIDVVWKMLRLGVVYAIAMFLIQANYKLDILILGWLATARDVGEYAVAVQIGELVWQLPAAAVVILMSRTANSKDNEFEIVDSITKTCRITLLVTIISVILLLIGVSLFAEFILGNEFIQVFSILCTLAIGLVVATIFKSINSYFAGIGKPSVAILVMSVSVVANVILNLLLIPNFGPHGAGLASTISYMISGVIISVIFARKFDIPLRYILIVKKEDFKTISFWKRKVS